MIRGCCAGIVLVFALLFVTGVAVFADGDSLGSDTGFQKPVVGAVITQGFGCTSLSMEQWAPQCPLRHWHSGVDLAVGRGTSVHATQSGTAQVIDDSFGYGLHVIIDHGNGLSSLYGHLDSVSVVTGDTVASGDVIGAVGSTGNSTGPHLHFEIRRDGIPEDPQLDLSLP